MKKSIYIIKNKINNKVYIGQAIDPHKRFIGHISKAKYGLQMPISIAINTLGKENFYYEILEKDVENYDEREKYWIKYYNSFIPNGYNIQEGGENTPPHYYGEDHPLCVVKEEDVYNIVNDLMYTNLTQVQIAKKYNYSTQIITAINNGMTHRFIDIIYPIRKVSPYHLSEKDVNDIQWLLQNTKCKIKEISEYYNVSTGTIKHINAGRNYYNSSLTYPLKTGRGEGEKEPVSTILAKRSTITIDT